jgi:hypothetical protein
MRQEAANAPKPSAECLLSVPVPEEEEEALSLEDLEALMAKRSQEGDDGFWAPRPKLDAVEDEGGKRMILRSQTRQQSLKSAFVPKLIVPASLPTKEPSRALSSLPPEPPVNSSAFVPVQIAAPKELPPDSSPEALPVLDSNDAKVTKPLSDSYTDATLDSVEDMAPKNSVSPSEFSLDSTTTLPVLPATPAPTDTPAATPASTESFFMLSPY